MLRGKDVDEIEELKRQGLSIRAISRLTGYDRKTIRKYLVQPGRGPNHAFTDPSDMAAKMKSYAAQYEPSGSQSGPDQGLDMLSTVGSKRKELGHWHDRFTRLEKSLPQQSAERGPAGLACRDQIDTAVRQFICKHPQLG